MSEAKRNTLAAAQVAMEALDLTPINLRCPWCSGIHFWKDGPRAWLMEHDDGCPREVWEKAAALGEVHDD